MDVLCMFLLGISCTALSYLIAYILSLPNEEGKIVVAITIITFLVMLFGYIIMKDAFNMTINI